MRTVEIEGCRVSVYGFWEFRNRFKTRLKWYIDWMKHLLAAYAKITGRLPSDSHEAIEVLRKYFERIAPFYLPLLLQDQHRVRRLIQEVRAELNKHGLDGFIERWYTTLLVAEAVHRPSRR